MRVIFFSSLVDSFEVRIHFYPWSSGSKAGVSGAIPLERRAAIVTARECDPLHKVSHVGTHTFLMLVLVQRRHIAVVCDGVERGTGHTEFISVIVIGGTPHS